VRDILVILILGFAGIKGIIWVSHDTALAIASRHWVAGEAVIDRAWLEHTYGRSCQPCYSLRTSYHFAVDGVQYQGDRFEIPPRRSGGDESYFQKKLAPYAPGSVVRILYDPKNPTFSVVTPPHLNYFFTIGLGGFALVISGFAIWRAYLLISRLIRGDSLAHAT
jgi:hypothetical protein